MRAAFGGNPALMEQGVRLTVMRASGLQGVASAIGPERIGQGPGIQVIGFV